jgi:hypothetical protein
MESTGKSTKSYGIGLSGRLEGSMEVKALRESWCNEGRQAGGVAWYTKSIYERSG